MTDAHAENAPEAVPAHNRNGSLVGRTLAGTPWWMLSLMVHLVFVSMAAILASLEHPVYADTIIPTHISRIKPRKQIENKLTNDTEAVESKDDPVPTEIIEPQPVINPDEKEVEYPVDQENTSTLDGPFDDDIGIGIGGSEGGPGGGQKGSRIRGIGETSKPVRLSTWSALKWLKRHQSPDGSWDGDGFTCECDSKYGAPCDGEASMHDADVGLTALAVLAYLGAGYTHDDRSEFAETVKRGLQFLINTQEGFMDDEDYSGVVALDVDSQHFHYGHAIAALALVEAYALTSSILFHDPAQRAVDYVVSAQNDHPEIEGEKYGWRYYPSDGDNDTSVTGWMVMALKAARSAKLQVPQNALDGVGNWLDDMTDDSYFRTGYQTKGGDSAMPSEKMEAGDPCAPTETGTAIAVISRIWLNFSRENAKVREAASLLAQDLPIWAPDEGKVDYYYWYYASMAMFQVGGEYWKAWEKNMKEALIDHQHGEADGCKEGSWDPAPAKWGGRGGRVYATAINCLTLEVYYRYRRIIH